ncbi:MAG: type II toxin-antitoxin system RelE/ParE family toxin [Aquirufa sp.]|jgi:plasmid stabilization system protein ParE
MNPKYTVIWERKALEEFKSILTYLKNQSFNASRIVKFRMLDRVELLKSNPRIVEADKLKNDPNVNFHAFVVFSYRLTYQILEEEKLIRILRIRHTSKEPLNY